MTDKGKQDRGAAEQAAIYTASGVEDAELVQTVTPEDHEALMRAMQDPGAHDWSRPAIRVLTEDDKGRQLRRCSFPWYSPSLLFLRPEAVAALEDLLLASGELLPMEADEEIFVWHVTRVIEGAVDHERSDITRFRSGRIIRIQTPEFVPEVIADADVFRLAEMPSSVFLSQRAVDRIADSGLQGLEFRCRWSANSN